MLMNCVNKDGKRELKMDVGGYDNDPTHQFSLSVEGDGEEMTLKLSREEAELLKLLLDRWLHGSSPIINDWKPLTDQLRF